MMRTDDLEELAKRSLEEIDQDFGCYPGYRAAQAKGTLCRGIFTAGDQAGALTEAVHLQPGAVTPVTARFSNFTSNPMRHDGALDIRGMATAFHLPNGEQTSITGLRMPRFFVGTASQFLTWQRAMWRNPWNDLPLPAPWALPYSMIGKLPRRTLVDQARPLCRIGSYAACRYNSLNAFAWVNGDTRRFVRYSWLPELPEERLRWWQLAWWKAPRRDPDYLRAELKERLERWPVRFRLEVQIAEGKDRVDDPSAKWSKRERIHVGQLVLTDVGIWDGFGAGPLRFEPTHVTNGIELPEGDTLMQLRKHVYEQSAKRRSAKGDVPPGGAPIPPAPRERGAPLDPNRKVHVNGVDICFSRSGPERGSPLLLIMGFACPMTWWHPDFIAMLEAKGFNVIRFDNRDCGRSSRIRARVGKLRGLLFSRWVAPYTIDEMAEDAAELLHEIGVPAAHVMGISLGGMVAQSLAIKHPQRVLSLTSINAPPRMRKWPPARWPTLRVMWRLMRPQPTKSERKWVKSSMRLWRLLNASHFPFEKDHVRRLLHIHWAWSRGVDPEADFRQLVAVLAARDRTPGLKKVRKPAVVIQGSDDPLVRPAGGRETWDAIEKAKLLVMDGMGHYTPRQTWSTIVDEIDKVAGDADRRAAVGVEAVRTPASG
jgi:pimeloyl-ACP methyl ester carboxylesterase